MLFRIGINLGDVLIDGDDILGDGVNIAARLEGVAEPGGICVSDDVYRQVSGKLDVSFEDIGNQQLKNIARPVHAYRARFVDVPTSRTSASLLPLPDKPSIAVLPFTNMSGDPEEDYFADGMAEDIITTLSRFKALFVIARNSSFAYKGRAVDVKHIGRELGVRYNSNLAEAWLWGGWVKTFLGEPELAIERFAHAMRLSPLDPFTTGMRSGTAHAHFFLGRYDEAASWAAMALHDNPDHQAGLRIDAASNAMAGRPEQAHKAVARLRQLNPALRVSTLKDLVDHRRAEDLSRLEEALRQAGLPE